MKYLVTGGAGFIGSHIVEALIKKNNDVIVLDNFSTGRKNNLEFIKSKKLKVIKVDISNYQKIEKYFYKVKKVFHLAALADIVPSIENPYSYFDSNVVGTLNILRASLKYKIKNSFIQPPHLVTEFQKLIQQKKIQNSTSISLRTY